MNKNLFGKKSKATEVAWTLLEEKNYLAVQERKIIQGCGKNLQNTSTHSH